ncbi:Mitochondrial import inner membrane translocase subunit tim9 [Thalictrum thalictroides]|uniref:Mitochondrial import inner membrane translocase subunit n=1 Tax=Thalictrum thalictroides TaxID=46969 RepID=A0A7J6VM98_THATH|nr:Mitochondrial import inner membrane translocase subunit tim9 [Thalictrum thalictroides]
MDKNIMGALEGLPPSDQQKMQALIEGLQMKDSLRMYNSLVERSFNDCVDSFRRKTLDKQEESCVRKCVEKYMKHQMRVGMRFAELNQGAPTSDSD